MAAQPHVVLSQQQPSGQATVIAPSAPDRSYANYPLLHEDYRALDELAMLEADWDSYGAAPISSDAIARAKEVVEDVAWQVALDGREAHPYYIGPIPDGGIQLEWRGVNQEVRVEVRADKKLNLALIHWRDGRKERERRKDVSLTDVIAVVVPVVSR